MRNKPLIFLSVLAVAIIGLFLYEKFSFPVKYVICDSLYENCFVHAKFKDIDDCKSVGERYGWYCDSTDKRNIKCEEKDSAISANYCSR